MSSFTSRLRLKIFTTADAYHEADRTANMNALDAAPGVTIVTSSTHPGDWGANQAGMTIYETDTKTFLTWSGTAFEISVPRGERGRVESLTVHSTASLTYETVVESPTINCSNRRHLIVVEAPRVYSTSGLTDVALFRGGTMLQEWTIQGKPGTVVTDQPRPLNLTTTDKWAGGNATYLLMFRSDPDFPGTVSIEGATNKPIALTVVEI